MSLDSFAPPIDFSAPAPITNLYPQRLLWSMQIANL
jgi:hypothetical protein